MEALLEERPEIKTDTYWAAETDPDVLVENCFEVMSRFYNHMHTSNYWRWAMRSWRYYHGFYFDDTDTGQAVKRLGPDGNHVGYAVNHVRNLVAHLHTLVTRKKVVFKTRALTSDLAALAQAELGDSIVDHEHREKGLARRLKRAAEHALVLLEGFMFGLWDPNDGPPIAEFEGSTLRAGDLRWFNPSTFDVIRDPTLENWEENQWAIVRTYENKWSLAARAQDPETRSLLVGMTREMSLSEIGDHARDYGLDINSREGDFDDRIPVYHFMHEDCDAVPGGRYFKFASPQIHFGDPVELPYEEIPLYRNTAGEVLMTAFGYSPALDLQGPQEILNMENSTIATNHASFGVQHIWCDEDSDYDESKLSSGVILIKGKQPAKGISLCATPAEHFKNIELVERNMETLSGINSVHRGNPEANLRSGEALKVMDARSIEFASPYIESYENLVAKTGTHGLRCYRDFMHAMDERWISITGETSAVKRRSFQAKDLNKIDRVIVEQGNPVLQTLSGKIAIADTLLGKNLLRTAEEYLTLIMTGQLKPMTKADQSQLDLVHAENDVLREGSPAIASAIDNHVLHIMEHQAELNTPEARMNEQLSSHILAHVMEHLYLLTFQGVQMLQIALGYKVPFPASQPGMPDQQGQVAGAPAADNAGAMGGPQNPIPQMPLGGPAGNAPGTSEPASDVPNSFMQNNLPQEMSFVA